VAESSGDEPRGLVHRDGRNAGNGHVAAGRQAMVTTREDALVTRCESRGEIGAALARKSNALGGSRCPGRSSHRLLSCGVRRGAVRDAGMAELVYAADLKSGRRGS